MLVIMMSSGLYDQDDESRWLRDLGDVVDEFDDKNDEGDNDYVVDDENDESGMYDHGSRMMNQGGCSSWGRDFKMVLNRSF